jgi:hypothetical protein
MAVFIAIFAATVMVGAVMVGLPWCIFQAWKLGRLIAAGVPDRTGEIARVEAEAEAAHEAEATRVAEEQVERERIDAEYERQAAERRRQPWYPEWEREQRRRREEAERRLAAEAAVHRREEERRQQEHARLAAIHAERAARAKIEADRALKPPKGYNPDKFDDRGAWLGTDDQLHWPPPEDLPRLRQDYKDHRALSLARRDRDRAAMIRRIEAARGR